MITKKRITVSITIDILKKFREILVKEDVSISFVVNMLIQDFIEEYNKEEIESE